MPGRARDQKGMKGPRTSSKVDLSEGHPLNETCTQQLAELVAFSNPQLSAKNYKAYKETVKYDPIKRIK